MEDGEALCENRMLTIKYRDNSSGSFSLKLHGHPRIIVACLSEDYKNCSPGTNYKLKYFYTNTPACSLLQPQNKDTHFHLDLDSHLNQVSASYYTGTKH